jgi:hypothetical protein
MPSDWVVGLCVLTVPVVGGLTAVTLTWLAIRGVPAGDRATVLRALSVVLREAAGFVRPSGARRSRRSDCWHGRDQ